MKKIITGLLLLVLSYSYGQTNLSNAEYFINEDPGYGNATSISISSDTALIDEIILNDLSIGVHWFYLRVQDEDGVWGYAEAVPFKIRAPRELTEVSPLSQAEYFFEDDPGFGLANEITVLSSDTILISEMLSSEDLDPGINKISLRFKNENDVWGVSESIIFYIRESVEIAVEKVAGMEYFIDEDPGVGFATYLPTVIADTVIINEWLESEILSDGTHQLGIRMQSDSGTWGLREWTEFEYLNCEDEQVSLTGETEFCTGDSLLIEGPIGYDLWSWNTHESDSQIYASETGAYYASVYDSTDNQCFLSDTLNVMMFLPPDPSFTFTSSFNTIELSAIGDGQSLFWQLNDEFSSIESNFEYTFSIDGWQNICLEATNICGVEEYCDSLLTCENYETPPYWYLDSDNDGFGVAEDSIKACEVPIGFADNILDCDDDDESIYPGAIEIPNDGIDQDCDGADLITEINENSLVISSISPNPAKDFIEITFHQSISGKIQLLNATGQVVLQTSIQNNDQMEIDIKPLPVGVYFIHFSNDKQNTTKRIIIQ